MDLCTRYLQCEYNIHKLKKKNHKLSAVTDKTDFPGPENLFLEPAAMPVITDIGLFFQIITTTCCHRLKNECTSLSFQWVCQPIFMLNSPISETLLFRQS